MVQRVTNKLGDYSDLYGNVHGEDEMGVLNNKNRRVMTHDMKRRDGHDSHILRNRTKNLGPHPWLYQREMGATSGRRRLGQHRKPA